MSKNSFWFKKIIKRYVNFKNILSGLISLSLCLFFTLIFEFALNRKWFDGLSVAGIIYICLGFLIIIFDVAQFKTWRKFRKLFEIKKENKEPFTNFEKAQMKVLNIKENDDQDVNLAKQARKDMFRFLAVFMIFVGIICLCISLPFIF